MEVMRMKLRNILLNAVADAVKKRWHELTDLRYGGVIITLCPHSSAYSPFCGSEKGEDHEYLFSIDENAEWVRPAEAIAGKDFAVDCHTRARSKSQGCWQALARGFGHRSEDLPEEIAQSVIGWTNAAGAIVFELSETAQPYQKSAIRVYVSIAGPGADLCGQIVDAAIPEIIKFAPKLSLQVTGQPHPYCKKEV